MRPLQFLIILLLHSIIFNTVIAQTSVPIDKPRAFISINGTIGWHTIKFKNFGQSPGASFGFSVSLGIYAVEKDNYRGGLHFTLVEGASRNTKRRQMSEEFELPNTNFDKHLMFNFAQFRSGNFGWFNEYQLANITVIHRLGVGIFGTTELDQLYDLGLHNTLGLAFGENPLQFKWYVGVAHDAQVGTGNPNYSMDNIGLVFGGSRAF